MDFNFLSIAIRLYFLSQLQSYLKPFLLRDVTGQAGNAHDLAYFVANDVTAIPDMAYLAVGPNDAVLGVIPALFGLLVKEGKSALVILWMNGVEPGMGIVIHAFARAAPNSFVGGAYVEEPHVLHVHQPEHIGNRCGELLKAVVALA